MTKKRKIYLVLALCALSMGLAAETKWDYINMRHEVRVGCGDQIFESLMWHNPTYTYTTMPASYQQTYHENYRHHQHLWAEYQWRYKHWLSFGGMLDVSEVGWDDVTRNGAGMEVGRNNNQFFCNIVIMPTVRFTYYHHPYVNLYSGLGFGMDINSGTETNAKGRHTDVGAAVNITVFGVSANYQRWFATVDFGGMTALKNKNVIFMALSRMINVSVGARF